MSSSSSHSNQLWIGGLDNYMTEHFVMISFLKSNEKPISVRVMRHKYTGEINGYGFVTFHSEEEAKRVMQKLNGKVMPNATSSHRFRLTAMKPPTKSSDVEYSLWVGDLSPEVDENMLYKAFASRYQTLSVATLVTDAVGNSKGFGFIRFGTEDDEKHCLCHMNGFKGLGLKPIRISSAHRSSIHIGSRAYLSTSDYCNSVDIKDVKASMTASSTSSSTSEKRSSLQELTYWQCYSIWQSCEDNNSSFKLPADLLPQTRESVSAHEDDLDLIEHNTKLDIDSSNKELIQRDYNFWDALECSKWTPVECYE